MQPPPSGPDRDEDEDTAFGGLAPRGGPSSDRTDDGPARPPRARRPPMRPGLTEGLERPEPSRQRAGHAVRWTALAAVLVVLLLIWLYDHGRL